MGCARHVPAPRAHEQHAPTIPNRTRNNREQTNQELPLTSVRGARPLISCQLYSSTRGSAIEKRRLYFGSGPECRHKAKGGCRTKAMRRGYGACQGKAKTARLWFAVPPDLGRYPMLGWRRPLPNSPVRRRTDFLRKRRDALTRSGRCWILPICSRFNQGLTIFRRVSRLRVSKSWYWNWYREELGAI